MLACVSLGEDGNGVGNKDVALLLQSLQQPQYTTLDSAELAVKPLEHLLSRKWSGSQSLGLREVEETVIGTAVMAQLSKGRWQNLSHLELCGKQLDIASILLLVKAKWAQLQQLQLTDSILDAIVWAQLNTYDWPSLRHLRLASSATPHAEAVLPLNLPKLACLHMSQIPMSPAIVHQLSQAPSLKLTSLFLQSARLGATACLDFAQADWSCLNILNLSNKRSMRAAAVRHLVQAQLPNLQSLNLSICGLDDLAIQWLIEGAWPRLEDLDLSTNHLDTRAVKYLVKGNWVSLKHLTLVDSKYDSHAIDELLKGKWPSLMCLSIDLTALNTVNAGMLRIGPHQLLECHRAREQISTHFFQGVLRNNTDYNTPSAIRSLWPRLQKIFVFALAGS